jgi:predicted dienelactone hydrolase
MMAGLIDMEHVAVAGHSRGGWTALLAGGARYDLENLHQWCDTERAAGNPFAEDVCNVIMPHEADMVAAAGLDAMPDGLWPSMGDPRVDAIVPMAGDAWLFGPDGLAEITVPMLAIGGTVDYGTPFEWGTRLAYDHVSSAQKVLVGLENADHFVFFVSCDVAPPIMTEIGACFDMVWDTDRIHDLINHFTTAFLLATLKGDAEAAFFLSKEAPVGVRATGVRYEAVGY